VNPARKTEAARRQRRATAQSNDAVRALAQRQKQPLLDTLKSLVEIESRFGSVAYFGAYDPAVQAGASDRLIAVAQLSDV
jgi:hypothetical protein